MLFEKQGGGRAFRIECPACGERFAHSGPPAMQPFSAAPSPSPTSPAVPPRFFCGLPLTLCASQEPSPLSSLVLLVVTRFEPSAICPFVPAPSCAVTPPILFVPVGLLSRMFPNRLMTRSLRLLDLTSPHVTAPACAQHEVPEAHCLGFPWFPLVI